uniref:Lipase maturation factor n=1 Tax=Oncorhynchus kisutch TaxID=8019 RepID=A0A8C7GNY0_ONCKI
MRSDVTDSPLPSLFSRDVLESTVSNHTVPFCGVCMCVCGGGGIILILILFLPRSLQTQPVPNYMSYYIHQSPWWFHLFEVLSNHFVELVILLFTFLGRRMVNGTLQIVFQVTLIVSGNLSFLNWLTIVPSMLIRRVVNVALGVLIGYLSIPVVLNLLSSRQVMNTSFSPLRIERTEVILQGTLSTDQKDPEAVWEDCQYLFEVTVDLPLTFSTPQFSSLFLSVPLPPPLSLALSLNQTYVQSQWEHNPFQGRDSPSYTNTGQWRGEPLPLSMIKRRG